MTPVGSGRAGWQRAEKTDDVDTTENQARLLQKVPGGRLREQNNENTTTSRNIRGANEEASFVS